MKFVSSRNIVHCLCHDGLWDVYVIVIRKLEIDASEQFQNWVSHTSILNNELYLAWVGTWAYICVKLLKWNSPLLCTWLLQKAILSQITCCCIILPAVDELSLGSFQSIWIYQYRGDRFLMLPLVNIVINIAFSLHKSWVIHTPFSRNKHWNL